MADVLATLALLGGTANDVAACLAKKGIRGQRDSHSSCPVAVFLASNGAADVMVGRTLARAGGFASRPEYVFLPDAVAEFIRQFDEGEWPELVEDADA